ncbi:MAG: DMT family transporter [Rhodocyclales bacterium]|jgi:drug/metabolite transporter (DMT)-like permease|nr:DMT family transporter [Rhodocyclales bacterium]CAG0962991.1 putative amino-acid metabolite efflux pump [Rhodocyclaceae bacterium]
MTGKTGRQSFLLALAPGLFVLLWSTGFIGAKLGLPYAEPLSFLLIRFACVIGLLGLLALVLRRPWPHRPTQWLHIAVAGALLHGGYLSGVFLAIHTGMAAGVVALIVGIQPLLTAFLSASMVGERVSGRQWMGLVLGFGGVTLVVWDKLGFGGLSGAGFAFSTLALVSITLGTLYQKRYCADLDLWSGSVIQFVAAALVLLPFALAFETMRVAWSGQFVFALGWLIFVLSLGAISLLHLLIRRGAATRVSALFYLVPPTTALLAFLIFGEKLGLAAVAGMAIAAAGVAIAVRK